MSEAHPEAVPETPAPVEPPVVTPVVPSVEQPVISPTEPPAESVTPSEPPVAPAVPFEPTKATGDLLGKPPEAAPEPEAIPEAEPEAAPAPTPESITYDLKFAKGLNVPADDPLLARFTQTANELRLAPEKAQSLVDLYGEAATNYARNLEQSLVQRQFDVFANTVNAWKEQSEKEPEWENRFETVLHDARRAIDLFGGTPEQAQETREMLLSSGTGNHPAAIRLLYNAISRFERLEATLQAEGFADRPAIQRALADFRNPLREARPGPRPTPTPVMDPLHPADRRYGIGRE